MRFVILFAALSLLSGCGPLLDIDLFVVGEKTALESQVLGTYQSLGRDLTAYASVRGVNEDGSIRPAPEMTDSQREVLRALNNQQYNRDDLDQLLAAGSVGEGNEGTLVVMTEAAESIGELTPELVDEVLAEENADRTVVLDRLMKTTPGLRDEDRPEVVWIFARMNQDAAPAGSWIQTREGVWEQK